MSSVVTTLLVTRKTLMMMAAVAISFLAPRNPHRLGGALEEHRTQQSDEHERDHDLVSLQRARDVRVLHEVLSGIRCGQRDRDQEVGGRETEQHQDEQLALPEREQPFEHRDRPCAVRALRRNPPVDRQRSAEGHEDQHHGRYR
jgi:hypothetical protein